MDDESNKIKRVAVTNDNYPDWTCHECAVEYGGSWPPGHVATMHRGRCYVCGDTKSIAAPRDYRYPKFKTVVEE